MKSDKTEVILLGAAAAVIALVVAFSMMDDKGSRKRSLEEITEDVEEEVGEKLEDLKNTATEVNSGLSKVRRLAEGLKSNVRPGSRTDRAINALENGVSKAKPVVETVAALIPQEVKDEARGMVREQASRAGSYLRDRAVEGGRAAGSYLLRELRSSWRDNNPFTTRPKPIPLPPGVGVGTRDL